MTPQKWTLLSKKDISPSKWFPIEERTYRLPNGRIVDDFSVTTLADVAMIIPIMADQKVVLVNQYKPGVDAVMMQFPAGRIEPNHQNMLQTAQHELEEETGIKVTKNQLHYFAKLSGFSTKATELVSMYLAENCQFNSVQNFDQNEEIEIIQLSFSELDQKIAIGEIWCGQTIAAWELAKKKFAKTFLAESAFQK